MEYFENNPFEEQLVMEESAYFYALSTVADYIKRYDFSVFIADLVSNGYMNADQLRVAGADLSKNNPEDLK